MTIALQSTLESRLSREWRVIGLVLSVLTIVLCASGITRRVDNVIYDWSLRVFPSSASKNVTVVAIDQKSIDALGAWPWPRSVHAKLLRKLAEFRPRAVDYDVLFLNPGADPAQDQELAGALSATPRTYLPAASEVRARTVAGYVSSRPFSSCRMRPRESGKRKFVPTPTVLFAGSPWPSMTRSAGPTSPP